MIRLPEFTLLGEASTPAEIAAKLADAEQPDEQTELRQAREAMLWDPETRAWYDLAVRSTIAGLIEP
jgi:hypothetical protein